MVNVGAPDVKGKNDLALNMSHIGGSAADTSGGVFPQDPAAYSKMEEIQIG